METIVVKLPTELAAKVGSLEPEMLERVIVEGLKVLESPSRTLQDYLPYMQTDDILRATRSAREKSRVLFEDQGVAALALFSDVL